MEYGLVKCGKEDKGGVGKKEIAEDWLHCSKIMKDMFVQAAMKAKNDVEAFRALHSVWLHHKRKSHLRILRRQSTYKYDLDMRMHMSVVVYHLLKTGEHEVPRQPVQIPAYLFPILKLTLKAKVL